MISLMTMLLTFIILYVPISYFFVTTTLYDNHFFLFVSGIILIYPIHKLLHYLPIAHLGSKIKKKLEWKYRIYPIIQIRVQEPISKSLFLFALLLPFIAITVMLVCACFLLPHYIHYITILLAYQTGISVSDLVYAYNIIRAPKEALIEENDEGFEILVTNNVVRADI